MDSLQKICVALECDVGDVCILNKKQLCKLYFDYLENEPEGQRLIAKIKSKETSFTSEELLHEFNSITRKFCLVKNKELLDLFKKEIKENLESFFDLFVEERCGKK